MMHHTALLKPKYSATTPTRSVALSKTCCLLINSTPCRPGGVGRLSSSQWLLKNRTSDAQIIAVRSAAASSDENSEAPSSPETPETSTTPAYNPTVYAKGSSALAIPAGLRSAGAVFILAGFLKILILCFPFSSMAISMFIQGKADLGTWAAVKMIPIALGVLSLAKLLVDRKLHERKYFHRLVVLASVLALLLSRWLFARTRPSPLDPLMAAHQQQVVAAVAEARKQHAAAALAAQQGRYLEPSLSAKEAVAQRPRGRFS